MKKFYLVFLFLEACNLHDRYPKPGEFCEPMVENPSCFFVDFKNKIYRKEELETSLLMTNRVQYKFLATGVSYDLEVLNENRLRVKPNGSNEEYQIYIRKKEPRRSYGERWGKAWEEIKRGEF